ncbi:hypothetical protein [Acinetobacter nematophilus]|uniref:Uncharacterized protein n=1 Tax=Acinetobacter nematophilus TaxID=2994642 RepID=A0A9X3DSG4_9GAMM|nr:hypothetical protein [Acinetobacter nematophilus]MCX5467176.1 hypothetical protein [Acinetobacter nematophilus]
MKLNVEQEKALEDHVFKRISVGSLKKTLGLNIENNQNFGFELLKLAEANKEEFALMLGMGYVFMDNNVDYL